MIQNGYVFYPSFNSKLHNWRPQSDFLYELLLALFLTIIMYQATAILFALFFGRWTSGRTNLHDLTTFMMAAEQSFRSVLGCFGKAAFRYSRGRNQVSSLNDPCEPYRRKHWPLLKALAILLMIPFIRVVSIALGLSHSQIMSFKQAEFGGLALGIGNNSYRATDGTQCVPVEQRLGAFDTPMSEFLMCFESLTNPSRGSSHINESTVESIDVLEQINESTVASIDVRATQPGRVLSRFLTQKHYTLYESWAILRSGSDLYPLTHRITLEDVDVLIQRALNGLTESCVEGPTVDWNECANDVPLCKFVTIRCRLFDIDDGYRALDNVQRSVALVNTEKFRAFPNFSDNSSEVNVDDRPFLERRSSLISLLVLGIGSACFLVARVCLELLVHVDTHIGIEMILKDALGIPCFDSILPSEVEVFFEDEVFFGRDMKESSAGTAGMYSESVSDSDGDVRLEQRTGSG